MNKKIVMLLLIVSSIYAENEKKNYVVELEKTTITAEKFEKKVSEVPKNITVIDSEDIKKSGAKNLNEALKIVPGIIVGSGFGSGVVDFRGQGETSQNNVLILIDGISINTIDMAGPDLSTIDINNIEKIEIIPSGGVIYGDKAVGGVINVITKDKGSLIKLEAGSFGYKNFGINYNDKIGDLSVHTDFSKIIKDGYRENSDFKKGNFGFGLAYDINEKSKVGLNYTHNESKYNYAGSLTQAELDADREKVGSKSSTDYTKNNYSLSYNYDGNSFSLENIISYNEKNSKEVTTWANADKFTSNLNNNFKIKYNYLNNSVIAGIDLSKGTAKKNNTDEINKTQLGIFAVDTYKVYKNLDIIGGFRTENVKLSYFNGKEKKYNENLFSLGTNYVFSETGSAYISFEQNYRTPVTDEYYTYGTFLEELEPQKSNVLEIGLKDYVASTYVKVAAFRNITENEIYYNPVTYKNENIHGNTERKGLELSTKTYLGNLTVSQAYTHLNATMKDGEYKGKTIPWVPNNKYSLKLDYNMNNLSLGTEYLYIGHMYAVSDFYNTSKKVKNYSLVGVNAKYKFKNMNIYGGINNLFDKKYNEYVTEYGYGPNYYPAEERNYYLGVFYEF